MSVAYLKSEEPHKVYRYNILCNVPHILKDNIEIN